MNKPLKVDYTKLSVDAKDPLTSFKKVVNNLDKFVDSIPCNNDLRNRYPKARRIIAIGDVHGDFQGLIYTLHAVGIISIAGLWIGGDAVLVQTGDIVDDCRPSARGDGCYNAFSVDGGDELVIIQYLADLNQQAMQVGGRVLLSMGNHEFMAIVNDRHSAQYIQPQTRDFYNGRRPEIFAPGGIMAKKLACLMNVVNIVGDWAFLHGGLNCSSAAELGDIAETNEKMKAYLRGDLDKYQSREFLNRIDNGWFFYDRRSSTNMTEPEDSLVCQDFDNFRKQIGIPKLKMVLGHTPQHFINSVCKIDGEPTIFRIDTSISRAFGNKENPNERLFALEIIDDRAKMITGKVPLKQFHVPHSDEYVDMTKKTKNRIVSYEKPKEITCLSDIRKKEQEKRDAYLETDEDLRADEAFIY